jgi:hypothetical protein
MICLDPLVDWNSLNCHSFLFCGPKLVKNLFSKSRLKIRVIVFMPETIEFSFGLFH